MRVKGASVLLYSSASAGLEVVIAAAAATTSTEQTGYMCLEGAPFKVIYLDYTQRTNEAH